MQKSLANYNILDVQSKYIPHLKKSSNVQKSKVNLSLIQMWP